MKLDCPEKEVPPLERMCPQYNTLFEIYALLAINSRLRKLHWHEPREPGDPRFCGVSFVHLRVHTLVVSHSLERSGDSFYGFDFQLGNFKEPEESTRRIGDISAEIKDFV